MRSSKVGALALSIVACSALMAPGTASAGVTIFPFLFATPTTNNLQSTAVGAPGSVKTVTITLNPNGQMTTAGKILSLATAGANAADFAIVPGGTCVPGTTILFPITTTTGQSCTVNLRYTPSAAATENATLQVTCQASAITGGFAVTCSAVGSTGVIGNLIGAIAAFIPVPTLDPWTITGLAMLLLALGTFFALGRVPQRNDRGRR